MGGESGAQQKQRFFLNLKGHAVTQLRSHAVKPRAAAHVDTFAEAA